MTGTIYRRRRKKRQRKPGDTTAAGYGYHHQQLLATLLALWRPGDLCSYCGQPMWQRWTVTPTGRRVSAMHLAHTPDRQAYEGLQHARCNLSEAAKRGNAARRVDGGSRVTVRRSRVW